MPSFAICDAYAVPYYKKWYIQLSLRLLVICAYIGAFVPFHLLSQLFLSATTVFCCLYFLVELEHRTFLCKSVDVYLCL